MNFLGFTTGDLFGLLIIAVIVVVILVILKFVLKTAVGILKMGCLVGVLIFAAAAMLFWLL